MTKLILVRHGQTVWNKELKYQGHTDIELSAEGQQQAELVADRLKDEKVAAVYSSDLTRAFVTAQTIAGRHNLPVTTIPELRELKFGEWEGLTYKAISEGWPAEMGLLYTHTDEVQIPGGETFRELKDRAAGAVAKLIEQHRNETIVVVSHGGTIRTILCETLDIHLNHLWDIKQDNTAVNIVEYYDERTIVALVNDSHHLTCRQ
jgi:alpha-ribazole phosphatase